MRCKHEQLAVITGVPGARCLDCGWVVTGERLDREVKLDRAPAREAARRVADEVELENSLVESEAVSEEDLF